MRSVTPKSTEFSLRLSKAIREKGTNQTHLANDILAHQGKVIQRQTISQYMNGISKPDTERLTILCNELEVSADYLLGLSDTPQKTHDDAVAAIKQKYFEQIDDAIQVLKNYLED